MDLRGQKQESRAFERFNHPQYGKPAAHEKVIRDRTGCGARPIDRPSKLIERPVKSESVAEWAFARQGPFAR